VRLSQNLLENKIALQIEQSTSNVGYKLSSFTNDGAATRSDSKLPLNDIYNELDRDVANEERRLYRLRVRVD